MGEEAELLRGMIADREQRISTILRKTAEQEEKQVRLAKDLEQVSQENMQRERQLQTEKTRLINAYTVASEQLQAMQRDLKQQGSSLQAYAGAVKRQQAGAGGVDTSYVMRMQAQLCKAMHSLGIGDHQMELAKKHADALMKMQKEAVAAVREEKSQVELEFMNELMKRDTELRRVENGYKARVDEIQKDVQAVRKQMDGSGSDDDDDGSENSEQDEESDEEDENSQDEEEDEEEKQAKEELMKMLQEQREKIQKLEKENSEQVDTIQELEEQLEEIQGVTSSGEEKVVKRQVASPENSDSDEDDDDDDDEEEGEEEAVEDGDDAAPVTNGDVDSKDEAASGDDGSGDEPESAAAEKDE